LLNIVHIPILLLFAVQELPTMNTGQSTWGLQLLPNIADTGLRAHKATAAPLELSAVPTAQPMQPVTPVPESAAGIRMSDIAHTSAVREYEAQAGLTGGGIGSQSGILGTAGGIAAAVGDVAAGAGREGLQQQQQVPHMRYNEASGVSSGRQMETRRTAAAGGVMGGRGDVYDDRDSSGRGVMGAIKDAAGSVAEAVGLGGSSASKGVTRREDYSDVDMAGGRDQGASSGRGMTAAAAAPIGGGYSSSKGQMYGSTASAHPVLRQGIGEEVVCGRKEFMEVEDRPIVKERVTKVLEHHPVQKEYVTEVR
jgi:hypothetical protein